jgi:hypothetical protein
MEQYAVVTYDNRRNDDNEIEITHVTDNLEYAKKLAFHYAKKGFPTKRYYGRKEYKILKNYYHEEYSIHLHNVIVDYRIGEVEYDDENDDETEKYDITDVWNNVWAVVKINNEIEEVEDIDESVIYEN